MLYDRVINVVYGDTQVSNLVTDLRVNFDILKTNTNISNRSTISIYNLNESNRASIHELNTQIIVSAGYANATGPKIIFMGDVLRVNHANQFPDIITKIESGDGILELRQARAPISFATEIDAFSVLQQAAKLLGLPIQEMPTAVSGSYKNGFQHTGSVKLAIDTICKRFNLDWSIQNGKLQVISKSGVSQQAPIIIDSSNGLLEKIEKVGDIQEYLIADISHESPTYKFKCLLNADITPGCSVTINDGIISGTYKVRSVQHQGDNFEGDFISICQVQEILSFENIGTQDTGDVLAYSESGNTGSAGNAGGIN